MPEWAQLRGGPPPPDRLERGRWYRVESRTHDGMVRVMGPGAVGVPLHESQVRIIDDDPDKITRIQGTQMRALRPGDPIPMLSYYGVCPKGHGIDNLSVADSSARCDECQQEYSVEDEVHI